MSILNHNPNIFKNVHTKSIKLEANNYTLNNIHTIISQNFFNHTIKQMIFEPRIVYTILLVILLLFDVFKLLS